MKSLRITRSKFWRKFRLYPIYRLFYRSYMTQQEIENKCTQKLQLIVDHLISKSADVYNESEKYKWSIPKS